MRATTKGRPIIWNRDEILANVSITERNCWEWKKTRNLYGYGVYNVKPHGRGMAHRLSYSLFIEPIPVGLYVLHRCDNPPCVNPAHLFLGTYRDNAQDSSRKGRRAPVYGQHAPNSKLTAEQARAVRDLADAGTKSDREIGRMFGISYSQVRFIRIRRQWTCLDSVSPITPRNQGDT